MQSSFFNLKWLHTNANTTMKLKFLFAICWEKQKTLVGLGDHQYNVYHTKVAPTQEWALNEAPFKLKETLHVILYKLW